MKKKITKNLEIAAFQELETALRASKTEATKQNLLKVATCYHNVGDFLSSIQCNTMAIEYYKNERDTKGRVYEDFPTDELLMSIADTNQDIGSAYYMLKEYDKAIWYNNRAAEIKIVAYGQHPIPIEVLQSIVTDYRTISKICFEIKKFYESIEYNKKALLIMDKLSEIIDTYETAIGIATIHYDIGKLYLLTQNYDEAKTSFIEALTKQIDILAADPLEQSLRLSTSKIYYALGHAYHNMEQFDKAEGYFIKARQYKLPVIDEIKDQKQKIEQEVVQQQLQIIIEYLEDIGLAGDM